MSERTRLILLICLGALAVASLAGAWSTYAPQGSGKLRVVFMDVGQGDAIYIESPTGTELLVDSGPDRSVLRPLARELGFFDRTLDIALATHEDKDHIGGFSDIFKRYRVATLIRTENQGESTAAAVFDRDGEEAGVLYARRGMVFDLGGGALLSILFPDRDPSLLESNTSSIVARLSYGTTSFLLTGDAPQAVEDHIALLEQNNIRSDVLKVGHHGSRTSTSPLFLSFVDPTYAVISSGKDNRYGHPHQEVVEALNAEGVTLLNTAYTGTIVFESDGQRIRFMGE